MNKKKRRFSVGLKIVVVFVLLCISFRQIELRGLASPAGTFIRVATTGADTPACGSDSNPCRTIQYAVNKADASGATITVAEGVYTYDPASDLCSWAITHAIVCIVDKNISILGGYTTNNWATSDPTVHATILDGQNSVRGVMVIKYNTTASLIMEGFTIQNCLARGLDYVADHYNSRGFGAGVWSQRAPMTLRHMILRNNQAIGGTRNESFGGDGTGGGVAIEAEVNANIPVRIEDSLIENNQALGGGGAERGGLAHGGGIFAYNAYLVVKDVVIKNNLAKSGNSTGDGIDSITGLRADALGGGVALQIDSSADFVRVQIIDNQVIGGGAGTASGSEGGSGLGGGLYIEEAPVTISDSLFSGNVAIGGVAAQGGLAFGGAVMINYTNVTIDRTQVFNNLARSAGSSTGGNVGVVSGGGLYMAAYAYPGQGHLFVTNSTIVGNKVEVGTPGITSLAGSPGITVQAVTVDIVHCTIADNQYLSMGRAGQAISVEGSQGPGGVPGTLNLRYSIISDHVNDTVTDDFTSALTVYKGSTANLDTVMFFGNTNNTNADKRPVDPGTINQVNTLLPTSPIGYVSPGSPDFDYHLQSSSPAIDQAIGSTTPDDIDGQSRPLGAASDVGPDEYAVPALTLLPDVLNFMTDNDAMVYKKTLIGVTFGPEITWNASTNDDWISIGSLRGSKVASGKTGTYLVVHVFPALAPQNVVSGKISVTSSGADPIDLLVNLEKVKVVYSVYLPLTLR